MTERTPVMTVKISDCIVQTFSAGGKGGQNQNRRSMGVRVIHEPSGARAEARCHREQLANKKTAFRRMAESPTFQRWIRMEHAKKTGAIEAAVEQAMKPENLEVEYYTPNG
jgi:protein subunit release factor B